MYTGMASRWAMQLEIYCHIDVFVIARFFGFLQLGIRSLVGQIKNNRQQSLYPHRSHCVVCTNLSKPWSTEGGCIHVLATKRSKLYQNINQAVLSVLTKRVILYGLTIFSPFRHWPLCKSILFNILNPNRPGGGGRLPIRNLLMKFL